MTNTNVIPSPEEGEESPSQFDARAAERFAGLALACVQQDRPQPPSDADVAPRTFPDAPFTPHAREALRENLTAVYLTTRRGPAH